MSTDETAALDENDASRDDGTVREPSAEERGITAPTPKDARARANHGDADAEDDEVPQPPAADTQAP
ncbi:hypothetical protein ACFZCK_23345 [Kitasatospora purpeofusca]|uniref:hypothetical protein n=1 Tax=Kitasatospora purpeofusca TaxID=67352 RepID=UPI0036EC52F3